MEKPHVLLVTFPTQGHINPSLQFAKRLVCQGLLVTFATSESAIKRISNADSLQGLSYATFSDGHDDGFNIHGDIKSFMDDISKFGSQNLRKLCIELGCPFTCVVYTALMPWVARIAREFKIPSMLLWDQPATVMDIYYYYFKGFRDLILDGVKDPSCVVQLPNLPPFASSDLPSFFIPGNPLSFQLNGFAKHFEILDEETNPKILVNTFDALESEALSSIKEYNVVGIGPLIPSAFLDENENNMSKSLKPYISWLDTKHKSSVIYIAFGSMSVLTMTETEEMADALLATGRPFLWVIRDQTENLHRAEELERQGMIVTWCSQVEVLSHNSIGCFVTHCGWNSTFESLASGVPMVGVAQWTDQVTNAKLLEDVWKVGVRVKKDGDGVVKGNEIQRCLESVMENEDIKMNAKKWKESARDAARENGSSYKNLKDFADEVRKIGGY